MIPLCAGIFLPVLVRRLRGTDSHVLPQDLSVVLRRPGAMAQCIKVLAAQA